MLGKLVNFIRYANWWFRFGLKVSLLSLRLPYSFFHKVRLFRHGAMDEKEYVERLWKLHFIDTNEIYGVSNIGAFFELGPGDSLSSAFKAKSVGFNHSILVDTYAFASDSGEVLGYLSDSEKKYKCEYLTKGKKSLETLGEDLVSFAFSNSVLQHIKLDEVKSTLNELYRISAKGCIQSHVIDLRDMIFRSSYHHDCPIWLWEAKFFQKFPIYTNRLRYLQWIESFKKAGFELIDVKTYDDLALSLDPVRSSALDMDNSIANIHLIVRKN